MQRRDHIRPAATPQTAVARQLLATGRGDRRPAVSDGLTMGRSQRAPVPRSSPVTSEKNSPFRVLASVW
jgi:hypothetical protein